MFYRISIARSTLFDQLVHQSPHIGNHIKFLPAASTTSIQSWSHKNAKMVFMTSKTKLSYLTCLGGPEPSGENRQRYPMAYQLVCGHRLLDRLYSLPFALSALDLHRIVESSSSTSSGFHLRSQANGARPSLQFNAWSVLLSMTRYHAG